MQLASPVSLRDTPSQRRNDSGFGGAGAFHERGTCASAMSERTASVHHSSTIKRFFGGQWNEALLNPRTHVHSHIKFTKKLMASNMMAHCQS
jgi:hypothetical protein